MKFCAPCEYGFCQDCDGDEKGCECVCVKERKDAVERSGSRELTAGDSATVEG